jgi:hypothetical protein
LPHRCRVVANRDLEFLTLAAKFYKARAFGRADPLDAAARKAPLVGHVKQPILEACRAEVGDEDFHRLVNRRVHAASLSNRRGRRG